MSMSILKKDNLVPENSCILQGREKRFAIIIFVISCQRPRNLAICNEGFSRV